MFYLIGLVTGIVSFFLGCICYAVAQYSHYSHIEVTGGGYRRQKCYLCKKDHAKETVRTVV
jgi:hypothetical protein